MTYFSLSSWRVLLTLALLLPAAGRAQEQLGPLTGRALQGQADAPTGRRLATSAAASDTVAVALPFFDDFSAAVYRNQTRPDTTWWQSGSGVYVNNQFALAPPTRNAATFDGLDAAGFPYAGSFSPVQQLTDSLVSRPLALAAYAGSGQQNTVYLSFYWQALGPPVSLAPGAEEDSLVLQFRENDTTWTTVWREQARVLTPFRAAIVQVPPRLLSDRFRFRFLCYGRPSGSFDVWNVDYVYLNAGRSAADTTFAGREEFAVSTDPTPLFKGYTALPYNQFVGWPGRILADSVFMTANLLGTPRPLAFEAVFDANGQPFETQQVSNLGTPAAFQRQIRLGVPVSEALVQAAVADSATVLTYTFALDAGNVTDPARLSNDTVAARAVLGNYYAHDDGSAELVYSLSAGLSYFAQAFYAPLADTLTHVRFYFPQSKQSTEGLSFRLAVWSQLDDTVRYAQSVSLTYPGARNAFAEYRLDSALAVQDTFYVGYVQQGSRVVKLGFDINTPRAGGSYYNVDGRWRPSGLAQPGNFMVRPVLAGGGDAGGRVVQPPDGPAPPDPSATSPKALFYPNPTSGLLHLADGVREVALFDVMGRPAGRWTVAATPATLSLHGLPPALYVLRLVTDAGAVETHKLLLRP